MSSNNRRYTISSNRASLYLFIISLFVFSVTGGLYVWSTNNLETNRQEVLGAQDLIEFSSSQQSSNSSQSKSSTPAKLSADSNQEASKNSSSSKQLSAERKNTGGPTAKTEANLKIRN